MEENTKNKIRRVIFVLLLILFFGVSIWVLLFSPLLEIHDIRVEGYNEKAVIKIVTNVVERKKYNFLPQNNLVLLSSQRLKRDIQQHLVYAQEIIIKKEFPNTIEISYKQREGVIAWCDSGKNNCYLIDETGEAFYKLESAENLKHWPVIIDNSNRSIKVGEKAIEEKLAEFCFDIRNQIKKHANIELVNEYSTPSFMSDEIKVITEDGWYILLNSADDAYSQARLLISLLHQMEGEQSVEKLDYVDLRLNGKIIYKLKGQEKHKEDSLVANNSEEELVSEDKDSNKEVEKERE